MLGFIKYEVVCDNYGKIYKYIMKNKIPTHNMYESKGVLYFEIAIEYKKEVQELFEKSYAHYKIINRKGIFYTARKLFKRKGLLIGGLVVICLCFVLSNIAFKFNILSEDENIQKDIMAVLDANGVKAGCFIPTINWTVIERDLKQKVSGISWAGISITGSTVTVDIVENVDKPQTRKIRMPCNLVAKYDAVIDKVEVFDGQLIKTVGSGVVKGDVIVSGTVINEKIYYEEGKEIKDIKTKYVRSYGSIYGTFTQKKTFFQPFSDVSPVVSDEYKEIDSLKIFDLYIPLTLSLDDKKYIEENSTSDFSFFGIKLPIGLRHSQLKEYSNKTVNYTQAQAIDLVNQQATNFESNFLENYEIINAKREEKITENGVEITAEYTLYGDISEEVEFFVSK